MHVSTKTIQSNPTINGTVNGLKGNSVNNYNVDQRKKWDYENGYYLTCETARIGKFLNQLEIYKKVLPLQGEVLEFGVYKGASFVRLITFRDLLEKKSSRKIIGFDAFGKFPNDLKLESDKKFVANFEGKAGLGISKNELEFHLKNKNTTNFKLVKGDIKNTLPDFLNQNPDLKIAMIHIDVDVYEPTKIILELLWKKLVPGGILMLDDYGIIAGETKAVDEFFKDEDVKILNNKYYPTPSYIIK